MGWKWEDEVGNGDEDVNKVGASHKHSKQVAVSQLAISLWPPDNRLMNGLHLRPWDT